MCNFPGNSPRVAMMQPAFMPWLGYFELMAAADIFIFLDDFQFSRGSWGQRNRILNTQGEPFFISLPVSHVARHSEEYHTFRQIPFECPKNWDVKLLKTIAQTYSRAPNRDVGLQLIEGWFKGEYANLADALISLIGTMASCIGISPHVCRSSDIAHDTGAVRSNRIASLLKAVGAATYLSAKGSFEYMREDGVFPMEGVEVFFQDHQAVLYPQVRAGTIFSPNLSALDAIMNLDSEALRRVVNGTSHWQSWQEMFKSGV